MRPSSLPASGGTRCEVGCRPGNGPVASTGACVVFAWSGKTSRNVLVDLTSVSDAPDCRDPARDSRRELSCRTIFPVGAHYPVWRQLLFTALVWVHFSGLVHKTRAEDPPTFHRDVAPILFRHCADCHRPGEAAPFPLLSYADAQKHARDIVDVTARRYMPPWLPAATGDAWVGERRLSEEEIRILGNWLEKGTPEGNPADSPQPPTWSNGWTLGPPDLVVRMPLTYVVPAGGQDVYRNFVIPLPTSRKHYVSAWQFRPHSRAVHHAFLRLDRSGEGRRRDDQDNDPGFSGMDTPIGIESPSGHFASWQPGAGVRRIPLGLSWSLEPGTDLVVQMHLQPLGRPEPLQAEIGFYFTDQAPTNQPIKVALVNTAIDLAPGARNVHYGDEFTLPAEADLLAILPHTHYLARSIEVDALLPEGRARTLLQIPNWDFNWQGDYAFRNPVRLPAGTQVRMRITFDNSTNNPHNPHVPPRRVEYGPNTVDEMAEVWLQLLPTSTADRGLWNKVAVERGLRDALSANQSRLRRNPGDNAARVNVGRIHLAGRRYDEALRWFRDAANADSKNDEAFYYLGLIHRVRGEKRKAMEAFEHLLSLNPNHAKAHGNLGLLQLEAGKVEQARIHFQDALRLNPNDAIALSSLGGIRLLDGQIREALPLLERAAELDPEDAQTRAFLNAARARMAPR